MKKFLFNGMMAVMALFLCHTAVAQNRPVKNPSVGDEYVATNKQKVAKAAEGEWKAMGKGLYRDDIITALYVVDNYEFEVDVEENTKTPGLYRLVKPYVNYPYQNLDSESTEEYMVIDATNPDQVFFRRYETGMDMGGGVISINSVAGDYYENGKFQQAVAEGVCGKMKDKVITFPKGALLANETTMGVTTYRIANSGGMFRLKLPGALELDVKQVIKGKVEKDGKVYVSVNYTLAKDVEKLKVAMFEGDYKAQMAEDIVSGKVASQEVTANGDCLFPYEKDGIYTFVAVIYSNGEVKHDVYLTNELSYLQVDWKDIGISQYTDGFLADVEGVDMGIDVETTPVKTQESTSTPGLFRLVDPYGLDYRYSTPQNYDTSRRYYMVIDASDPNRVVLKKMEDGCGLMFNVGHMILWCNAERYVEEGRYTKEDLETMDIYGVLRDGQITFPISSLCMNFRDVPGREDTWYWANSHGYFKVVLPEGTGINTPVTGDNANAPVEYYTLEGMKVSKESLKSGVYVKKQGSEAKKIIIK